MSELMLHASSKSDEFAEEGVYLARVEVLLGR